jgi:hypothetical protein
LAVIKDDAGGAFVMIEREDAIKNRTEDMDGAGLETSRSIKQQIPPAEADPDEEWVKKYIEEFGTPPSFF